ncbi:MAG TPA: helix-turn-helix transcriptional regulator [Syntrophomonadaceae bacterium]|nr:helix-turn-helix transcriptional regulator [Syntrophomonadaceae bacterium]HHW28567.1 helix-turn-helix transcriptional regulator [Syntrophomonadaceae bacterium]
MINRIRTMREQRGWTQEYLASLVQVSRQTINSLETGRYKPSIVLALKLAHVFKVPLEEVFELESTDWE